MAFGFGHRDHANQRWPRRRPDEPEESRPAVVGIGFGNHGEGSMRKAGILALLGKETFVTANVRGKGRLARMRKTSP